jgi:WD40 repeat protein
MNQGRRVQRRRGQAPQIESEDVEAVDLRGAQGVVVGDNNTQVNIVGGMVNYRTVQQLHFHGEFRRLRDATLDLDLLPADLRLVDPGNPDDLVGLFAGRRWLIDEIDEFIDECVIDKVGGYLFIEAEAGMGKTALATYLAFTRDYPTHVTRLPGGGSPETARTNLVAQLIARWDLHDAVPGGVLPAGHDTTGWLAKQLLHAADRRDQVAPREPVVLLVDGLDEASPPLPGELPLGLPGQLPSGTVMIATTRPGTWLPMVRGRVRRIEVESELNHRDLLEYLGAVTERDPRLAEAITNAAMTREGFCRGLAERSGGVWIYAVSVLDQVRDGRDPCDVTTLPAGLTGYYGSNIMRWRADPTMEWDMVGLPLLAMLATVRRPQSAECLASWAGLDRNAVRTLLRGRFKAFLVARPDEDGDPDIYALRHQSLRDFCTGTVVGKSDDDQLRELTHDLACAARDAHARITDALTPESSQAGRDWGTAPDYAREHLAEHAAVTGRLDELLHDPGFLAFCSLPELLRQRRWVTSPDAQAVIAVVELAFGSWRHDNSIDSLLVAARKLGNNDLADRLLERAPQRPAWHARRVLWKGHVHRTLHPTAGAPKKLRLTLSLGSRLSAVPLPDGTSLLASAGADGMIRLWDPATGALRRELDGNTGQGPALTAVPLLTGTTLLACAGQDGVVRLWDATTGALQSELNGELKGVFSLASATLPDGTTILASTEHNGPGRLWDPTSGASRGELEGARGVSQLVALPLPDSNVLLAGGGGDGLIRLWDPSIGALRTEFEGHSTYVTSLAAVPLPDGRNLLASAGHDDMIRLWDPIAAQVRRRGGRHSHRRKLDRHTGAVGAFAAVRRLNDTTVLARLGDDREIRIWDPATQDWVYQPGGVRARRRIPGRTTTVRALAAMPLPDGRNLLASAGHDDMIRLWDPTTGAPRGEFEGDSDYVSSLAAVPLADGGNLLASAGHDDMIRLWDPSSNATTIHGQNHMHTGRISALVAVPLRDGKTLLATADDQGTIMLWDPTTGTLHSRLEGRYRTIFRAVRALATVPAPDGTTLLASAGDDLVVRLWNPNTGTLHSELEGHLDMRVDGLAAIPLPDGTILLASAGSERRGVRLWDLASGTLRSKLQCDTGGPRALVAVPTPDGTTLLASAGEDRVVRLWDPHISTLRGELEGNTGVLKALVAVPLPDGTTLLAGVGDDHIVRLWDPTTLRLQHELKGHDSDVSLLAAVPGPDGTTLLASASINGEVILWTSSCSQS